MTSGNNAKKYVCLTSNTFKERYLKDEQTDYDYVIFPLLHESVTFAPVKNGTLFSTPKMPHSINGRSFLTTVGIKKKSTLD